MNGPMSVTRSSRHPEGGDRNSFADRRKSGGPENDNFRAQVVPAWDAGSIAIPVAESGQEQCLEKSIMR